MSPEASRAHTEDPPSALARGTRLGEFELLRVLGIGGFGIVYLAFDHALEREVAVKEYMPASLVGRTETMHVTLRSQSDAETFALGLKSFVNEARLLARFNHDSLLKVLRFWEGNGTAYMAMPVLRGQTLKELRLTHKQAPDEAWMRGLLEPLLGAIERLHSEGVYHRDIAPDNIQIEADGHPVLLDFGAARRVISDKSQNLTAILKPAYAPIEQYAEVGSVKQGPWTDLYALGATLYFLLQGRPPSPATARSVHDDVAPLSSQTFAGCSEDFLHIIDWMLAPRPSDRPQNVTALLDVLHGRAAPPRRRVAAAVAPSQWDQTVIVPTAAQKTSVPNAAPPAASAPPKDLTFEDEMETMVVPRPQSLLAGQAGAGQAPAAPRRAASSGARTATAAGPRTPGRSKLLPLIAGLGALAVAAVVAAVVLWPRTTVPSALDNADAAAVQPTPAAPAPSLTPPADTPTAAAQPDIATVVTPAPPANPVAPPPEPAKAQVLDKPLSEKPLAVAPTKPAAATPAPAATPRPVPSTAQNTAQNPAQSVPAAASTAAPDRGVKPAVPPRSTAQAGPASTRPQDTPGGTAPSPYSDRQTAPAGNNNPAAAVPSGPETTCSGKNPLLYFVCMERECLRTSLTSHPDCQKWRVSRPPQQ